ncbi:MAG: hypothetical protein ACTHL1_10240 [Burkholderiaceae bacterium]
MFILPGTLDERRIATGSRILRREDYAALCDAAALVEAAHARVAAIEEAARERGFAYGLDEARRQACGEVGELHAGSLMAVRAMRERLASLAAGMATRILTRADRRWLYEAALQEAMAALGDSGLIDMRVHSDELDIARAALARLERELGFPPAIRLRAGDDIAPGDCVADTPAGSVRTGIAMLVEAIEAAARRAFLDAEAGAVADEDCGGEAGAAALSSREAR